MRPQEGTGFANWDHDENAGINKHPSPKRGERPKPHRFTRKEAQAAQINTTDTLKLKYGAGYFRELAFRMHAKKKKSAEKEAKRLAAWKATRAKSLAYAAARTAAGKLGYAKALAPLLIKPEPPPPPQLEAGDVEGLLE